MFKKSLIILIVSCVLMVFLICVFFKSFTLKKLNNNIFSINKNVKVETYIKDRFVLNSDYKIEIGKNEKEIKNNYIDLSIKYNGNEILVLFNKLFKEEKVSNIYVNENYLLEILKYLNGAFKLNLEERNLNELVVIIKDNYMNFRINGNDKFQNNYTFETPYKFSFYVKYNMLNMSISFE